MSVVLPKDHTASSASPLPCVTKAGVSTALGRSLIYIAQRKTIFWKTNINHGQYSKSQCFHSKTQSNAFILAKEQASESENNSALRAKEPHKGFSSSGPCRLLRRSDESSAQAAPAVSNEPCSQRDSLHGTYSDLAGLRQ